MPQSLEDTAGAVAAYLNPVPPARAAAASMSVAVDANPDLEAELRRAAERTGVPIDAAREYPQDVKRQAALAEHDFDAMAAQFPATTKFLADPENARLSHDDIRNLSDTEMGLAPLRGPKGSFFSGAAGLMSSFGQGADMARQGIRLQMADLYDSVGLFSRESNAAMRADAQSKFALNNLQRQVDTPEFESSTAQGVYSGLSSTVRAAPGIAASIATRSTVPMLATMGVQTEAEAYGKYRGRGATAGEALVGAAGEGAVEVATEMLPMGYLVKNMGKVGAGTFLTGLLAREIPGEQVATLVQDAIDTAVANPDKTWQQYLEERPGAAYQTLVATVTQSAVMGGMSAGMQRVQQRGQQAEQATQVGEALAQFNDLAAASKVRERDISTAQTFFQSLVEDGRDTVWITPQALAESGLLEQVAAAIPAVANQLEQGAATGADIRIPIADLMATMAGPEIANSLLPHLAEEPGGFTPTTANEYMQSGAAQELADEVERTLQVQQVDQAFNASRDNVATGVLAQLTAAGRFSPSVNEAYASMVGNFFAVQGARLGISPEEMAARYPLQVRAERMPGSRTLDQAANPARLFPDIHIGRWGGETRDRWQLPWEKVKQLARKGVVTAEDAAAIKKISQGKESEAVQNIERLIKTIKARPVANLLAQDGAPEAGAVGQPEVDQPDGSGFPMAAERGSLSFGDDITAQPSIITLLAGADLSTFLHEAGHFFLEVQNDIASRPDAPAEIQDDMAATLEWFGVPDLAAWDAMDLEQKRPHHEKFARGFEAYLFEGKAPTPELAGLFSRFRSWMVNVYRSLTSLNVELTPEVRGVFDRMLASADAIEQAEQEAGFAGMFGTKPEFMTDEEWGAYRGLNFQASQDAVRELETRSIRDMQWLANAKTKVLRDMQRANADKRKAMREEVATEVMAEPVNRARTFLSRGLNPDGTPVAGPHKLAIPALIEMYGGEGDKFARLDWEPLGYGKYGALAKEGITPDEAAELLGFESGDDLVRTLLAEPPATGKIDMITAQRMLEQYGDLNSPEVIDQAIAETLHSRAHIKFLGAELNALKKASGSPAILGKAAQAYADKIVRRTVIRDLRPDQYTAAARRAARAADKAFKAGDIQEAAAQKQIQLVNTYAAKSAMDARADVAKTMTRFTRIANGNNETAAKTRDMDMVQATRAILAEFGVGSRGKKATEYLAAVEKYDTPLAAVLREHIDAATENAMPIKDMTIEQLGALKDEVESLWFLAKRSRQMEVDGDLLDRQEIQEQLAGRLEEIGIPETVPGEESAITPWEVRLSQFQGVMASLRRVESWAGAKDGATAMGPFRKYIWNTIKDATDAYRMDKAKYLRKYRELLAPIAPSLAKVKIAAPELGYTFGKDGGGMGKVELLHAILHTGNIGNKRKMLLGRGWATEMEDGSLDTSKWDAFVNRMIAEGVLGKVDFDFAQGVWNLMEEMKPAAQKAHREAYGRYFDEVTADAFTTPWGAYAGGYVPAIADSRIVTDAKTRGLLEEQAGSMANAMPATSKGFTKGRVEYNAPLLLDLRLLSQHIDKVLLFSHLEQPTRDVRRILASNTVSKPLHKVDPAAIDELLTPWLNRTALQQVETPVSGAGGKAAMRVFSMLRQRAGMAAMFANVSNTVQQLTGFSTALLKVKPKYLMDSMAQFLHAPADMTAAVAGASPYMANRMENEVGAMTGAINDILLNPNLYEQGQAWALKHTYFLQSAMDNVMGPVIWTGAYNQALETAPAGMTDEQLKLYARRLADSTVRETQGSTLPEDIARFETGNAFMRMFTQFAGYFNMQANLLGTEFSKVAQETGLSKKAARAFYVSLFGFLAPAWIATAIAIAFRGGPDDDDKDGSYLDDWFAQVFGWGTVRSGTAMIPVLGQTANAAMNKFNQKPYDDRISTGPAISMLESAAGAPGGIYDLATGNGSGTKTVRDVATLLTLATGLPASGSVRPLAFATEVASGRAAPTGPVDVARGAITGTASPASKGR
jgi:hypothetical protein